MYALPTVTVLTHMVRLGYMYFFLRGSVEGIGSRYSYRGGGCVSGSLVSGKGIESWCLEVHKSVCMFSIFAG
jgi:hypothetical protein